MLKKLKCLWTVKELREKLLFTVMILLMFCAGSRLPAPFVAPGALGVLFSGADFLSYLNMMSGSSLAQCTVFSLGVAPAINASIIMQLLCVAIPKWERYAKDDDGKKRIERYTQLCTLILAVVMAVGYYFIARNYGAVKYTAGFAGVLCGVIVVSVFAAGAMTVQWLGTLIDARGIGSGLSMLIFAGIVSRWSGTVSVIRQIAERVAAGQWGYMAVGVFLLAFMLASLLYAVCLNAAEKRIPVQYVNYIIQKSDGTPESIMHEAAEWLFAHAEYDHDEQTQLLKSRANLVGAFIDGKAVCAGYSRAAAYCLLRAGYSAAYCVGEAGGVCHAWNAYVDSTGRLVFADVTYAVTANDDLMVESFLDMEAETVSTRITDSEDWYFAG